MRVPAVVTIAIVALCATTGLVLGWLFPLNPSRHNEVEHSQVANASRANNENARESMDRKASDDQIIIGEDEHLTEPLVSPTTVPNDASSSDGPHYRQNTFMRMMGHRKLPAIEMKSANERL